MFADFSFFSDSTVLASSPTGWWFLTYVFYFHPYFREDGSPMLTCAYVFFKLGWGTNHQPDKGKMVSPFYRKSWHAFCSLLPWIWLFVGAIKGDEILPKYVRIMIKPLNKDPYQTTKDILDLFKVNFIIHPPWFWWAKAPESWSVLCVLYVLRLYLTSIFGETNYRLGLGGDFKIFQIFLYIHPYLGTIPMLTIIFFTDGLKSPTSRFLECTRMPVTTNDH